MKNNIDYCIVKAMLIPYEDFEVIISQNSWVVHPDIEGFWYEDLFNEEVNKDEVHEYLEKYFGINKIIGVTSDDTIDCVNFIIIYDNREEK